MYLISNIFFELVFEFIFLRWILPFNLIKCTSLPSPKVMLSQKLSKGSCYRKQAFDSWRWSAWYMLLKFALNVVQWGKLTSCLIVVTKMENPILYGDKGFWKPIKRAVLLQKNAYVLTKKPLKAVYLFIYYEFFDWWLMKKLNKNGCYD